jgi:hypothetical protein
MSPAEYKVRRAVVDDLPQLIVLWRAERLPWEELERQLTDFQVVTDSTGKVHGTLAIRITANQGLIHSEAFLDSAEADVLRDLLWKRVQTLATNHALYRLWTCITAPFWTHSGFRKPNAELAAKIPPSFGHGNQMDVLVLELRPEPEIKPVDLEREFELFREAEKERTEAALRQARTLRTVALIIAAAVFIVVFAGGLWMVGKSLFSGTR